MLQLFVAGSRLIKQRENIRGTLPLSGQRFFLDFNFMQQQLLLYHLNQIDVSLLSLLFFHYDLYTLIYCIQSMKFDTQFGVMPTMAISHWNYPLVLVSLVHPLSIHGAPDITIDAPRFRHHCLLQGERLVFFLGCCRRCGRKTRERESGARETYLCAAGYTSSPVIVRSIPIRNRPVFNWNSYVLGLNL